MGNGGSWTKEQQAADHNGGGGDFKEEEGAMVSIAPVQEEEGKDTWVGPIWIPPPFQPAVQPWNGPFLH